MAKSIRWIELQGGLLVSEQCSSARCTVRRRIFGVWARVAVPEITGLPQDFRRDACLCLFLAASLLASPVLARTATPLATVQASPDRMDAHFHADRQLTAKPGSGWTPFNRIKWLHEFRDEDEVSASGSLRLEATRRAARLRAAGPPNDPSWRCLGPTNIAGRILSIEFQPEQPETVYLGSASGGIWRSTNAGATWMPLDDALPTLSIGAVAVLPQSPRTIVIGTGEPVIARDGVYGLGILRSTDGGITWTETNIVQEPFHPHMGFHAIEPNTFTGVLLAAGTQGLLRSTDEGATWISVFGEGNWTDVQWRPGSGDSVIAVREYGGVFLSADGGVSFQPVTAGLPDPSQMGGLQKIAWSASNPDDVYAGFSAAGSFRLLGIYGSTDGGATWELRSAPDWFYGDQGSYNNTIVVDPLNPDRLFVGGVDLHLSNDGGRTWLMPWEFNPINVHADHHAIAFRPGPTNELWVGTDGGIYRSLDGGWTWWDRNRGLVTLQLYDACAAFGDSTIGYGGSQDNGIPRYRGSGEWLPHLGGDGMICQCDPADPMHVYGEYQLGYHVTTRDGFEAEIPTNEGLEGNSRWVAPVDMDPSNPMRLLTATSAGIFQTTDGEASWSWTGPGTDVVSISISAVTSRRIWAQERSSGIVRTSEDGGATWTSAMVTSFAGIGGTKVLADPRDSLAAFCAYLHHPALSPLIYRTLDGGASWTDVTGDLGEQSVNTIAVDPADPTRWFLGTDVGVWLSENGGVHWRPYGSGLPNVLVEDLEFRGVSGELRAATYGRGLWAIPAGRSDREPDEAPRELILEVTSQNPSHTEFVFRFGGPPSSRQEVSVYTVTGRLITRLFSGVAGATLRSETWSPRELASGVYVVALRSGGQTITRKVVVVR